MITELLIAAGIPSAITGFAIWLLKRQLTHRDEVDRIERQNRQRDIDERSETQEQLQLAIIQSVNAALALSEATARAVQRIPDAHCNGDMHAALEYAEEMKHKQRDLLAEQGVRHIL